MSCYTFLSFVLPISILCLKFILTNNPVLANIGGHALFASLSQLEELWINDIRTVYLISELSNNAEGAPDSLDL